MNLTDHQDTSINPRRTGSISLWIGLIGAPLAWITQLSLSEPLAAHACYPYQAPLSEPIWEWLPAILTAVSLVCLTATLLSGFVAWRWWRRSGTENGLAVDGDEHRQRFLASLSLMSCFIFTIAILFNLCAIWLVSPCSSWF